MRGPSALLVLLCVCCAIVEARALSLPSDRVGGTAAGVTLLQRSQASIGGELAAPVSSAASKPALQQRLQAAAGGEVTARKLAASYSSELAQQQLAAPEDAVQPLASITAQPELLRSHQVVAASLPGGGSGGTDDPVRSPLGAGGVWNLWHRDTGPAALFRGEGKLLSTWLGPARRSGEYPYTVPEDGPATRPRSVTRVQLEPETEYLSAATKGDVPQITVVDGAAVQGGQN